MTKKENQNIYCDLCDRGSTPLFTAKNNSPKHHDAKTNQ
jgi:hypothetical protein